MAKNLQSKLSSGDSVRVFDVNNDAMQRLADEMEASQAGGAAVELAQNVSDAAKESVSGLVPFLLYLTLAYFK
jgi:3-hydroxyisobutyrate/3-hydroxypropionate dehydrogenase